MGAVCGCPGGRLFGKQQQHLALTGCSAGLSAQEFHEELSPEQRAHLLWATSHDGRLGLSSAGQLRRPTGTCGQDPTVGCWAQWAGAGQPKSSGQLSSLRNFGGLGSSACQCPWIRQASTHPSPCLCLPILALPLAPLTFCLCSCKCRVLSTPDLGENPSHHGALGKEGNIQASVLSINISRTGF